MKFTESEGARFLVAGALNTAATYVLYLLLLAVATYRVAFTISFVTGVALSYYLSCWFVFRSVPRWRSAFQFPLVCVAQFGLGLVVLGIAVDGIGMSPAVAPIIVVVVTIPVTFFLSRRAVKDTGGVGIATISRKGGR